MLGARPLREVEVAVAPVFTALHAVAKRLEGSAVALAAQNCFWEDQGAWTGEVPQPNEWIHLWRYKNLQERFEARAAAMKDPEWQTYLAKGPPLLAEMHSTLLMPTNYSPLK